MAAEGLTECVVCRGTALEPRVHRVLSRCRECGHVFYGDPPGAAPSELYDERYFAEAEYRDYKSQRRTFARNFDRYLRMMARHGASGGRLLEIGAAYGFFLAEARGAFVVEGIDVSAAGAAWGREHLGLPLHCGDFLAFEPAAPYDVVCLWDTVEHLSRPDRFLARARDLLVPGGRLFLTTGDIGSVMARLRGARWRMIHPPTHLHYFSRPTIRRLLERLGFAVTGIQAVGTYRALGNIFHGLSLFAHQPWLRSLSRRLANGAGRGWGRAHLYLNLFDVMFVGAQRV